MIFQRVELHNHTTESDGNLTVYELADYAVKKNFGVLALTDHNVVSGQNKMQEYIQDAQLPLKMIPGIEITTFYAHILTLGLRQMVDFTDLNPNQPEKFMYKLRRAGAKAIGIAHPFCIGRPVMTGCRNQLHFHDLSCVDYIEIFNTSGEERGADSFQANVFGGNLQAIEWWEQNVLDGYRLAAVTGKDIHSLPKDVNVFITLAKIDESSSIPVADKVIDSILHQRTICTKGPILDSYWEKNKLVVESVDCKDTGWKQKTLLLVVKDNLGHKDIYELDRKVEICTCSDATVFTVKAYDESVDNEHLVCIGMPIYRQEVKE